MLKLTKVETAAPDGVLTSYEVTHSTPGRDGTTVKQILEAYIYPHKTKLSLVIDDCEDATPAEALAKMSRWLRRLADGIDEHKGSTNLPL